MTCTYTDKTVADYILNGGLLEKTFSYKCDAKNRPVAYIVHSVSQGEGLETLIHVTSMSNSTELPLQTVAEVLNLAPHLNDKEVVLKKEDTDKVTK